MRLLSSVVGVYGGASRSVSFGVIYTFPYLNMRFTAAEDLVWRFGFFPSWVVLCRVVASDSASTVGVSIYSRASRWGWGAQNATLNNTSQRDRAVLQIHVRLV